MLLNAVSSLTFAALVGVATAQDKWRLVDQKYKFEDLPYKVDPGTGPRGPQYGYNICNSTTEGPKSLCQTAITNTLREFSLFAPPEPNSVIGEVEHMAVVWNTVKGFGGRVMIPGTLKAVQFIQTPDYVQIVGLIDQKLLNIRDDDPGGEMDSAGADDHGNPQGGQMFSNAFITDKTKLEQIIHWTTFIGSGTFCMKICDPKKPSPERFCEHQYDRVGAPFNCPSDEIKEGVFESCQGENMDFPGEYTGSDGIKTQWKQRYDGPVPTPPYVPRVPPTSNCKATPSAELYGDAPAPTATVKTTGNSPPNPASTGTGTRTGSSGSGSTRSTGSNAAASRTPTPTPPPSGSSRSAIANSFSFIGAFLAMIFFI